MNICLPKDISQWDQNKLQRAINDTLRDQFGIMYEQPCGVRRGQTAFYDEHRYVRNWIGKIAGNQLLLELGFTGRFFNAARTLDEVKCVEIVQSVYNSIQTDETFETILGEGFVLNVSQVDICADYLGLTVDQMTSNFTGGFPGGKIRNKTNFPDRQVRAFPAIEGTPLESLYLNHMSKPKKKNAKDLEYELDADIYRRKAHRYNIKITWYDKVHKFRSDPNCWDRYTDWLSERLGDYKDMTRMEFSIKNKQNCSCVTRYFQKRLESGEIIEEEHLIGSVLKTYYPRNEGKRKHFKVRMNSGDVLEPTMKNFFKKITGDVLVSMPVIRKVKTTYAKYEHQLSKHHQKAKQDLGEEAYRELLRELA
jgi:hypothetical protein